MKISLLSLFALAAAIPASAQAQSLAETFALDAARDYRVQARFPESSRPIAFGQPDPISASREVTKQSLAGPGGAAPVLTVWASGIAFQAGQTVDLFAQLSNRGMDSVRLTDVLRSVTASKLSAQLLGENSGLLGEVTYLDNGLGVDTLANDGVYSARFMLPAGRAPAAGTAESVLVKVSAQTSSGELRQAVGGFQFSNPGAVLTGHFTDVVRDGNLVLAAQVNVLAPGRYHLAGTLTDLAGAPVAEAQAARAMTPGTHWLELTFYGLAFHDRGVAGALSLGSATLTSTNGMPNALGPVLSKAHVTKAYSLAQFTTLPFNNPELLEAAARIEADALMLPAATPLQ
jgi:hypothetical protein